MDPKKPARKQRLTGAAKVRADVVSELKPYITELFDSVRAEIQDLRANVGTPPEAAPGAAQAQPINLESVGQLLKGSGLGDDQIGKLTSMFQSMQAANQQSGQTVAGPGGNGVPPGPNQQGGFNPMQMMMFAELIKALAPLFAPQNPMMQEMLVRSMYDTLSFNAAMHRKVMMQNLGASPEQIAQAAGMPYMMASNGLMGPAFQAAAAAGMPGMQQQPQQQPQPAQSQPPVPGAQQ